MSRFPDLAALRKLVAASALETKRKSMKLRAPFVLPHHQRWVNSSLSCRGQNYRDQAEKAGKSQWDWMRCPKSDWRKKGWELDLK